MAVLFFDVQFFLYIAMKEFKKLGVPRKRTKKCEKYELFHCVLYQKHMKLSVVVSCFGFLMVFHSFSILLKNFFFLFQNVAVYLFNSDHLHKKI